MGQQGVWTMVAARWRVQLLLAGLLVLVLGTSAIVASGASADEQESASMSAFEVASALALSAGEVGDPFALNSLPGSKRTIYLDFTGYDASDSFWPGALGVDEVSSASLSDSVAPEDLDRLIVEIWQEVAEHFSPFDVNVTTEDPGSDALIRSGPDDDIYGMRVAIGERTPAFPGDEVGIAFQDAFDQTDFDDHLQPAWVLPSTGDTGRSITAAVASHEVGHTLGLRHLANSSQVVNPGNATWEPMMSASFVGAPLIQWAQAANDQWVLQDDIAEMARRGVVVRADDHGDVLDSATDLGSGPVLSASGIISTSTDVDVFAFTTGSTVDVDIAVNPAPVGPSLNIRAELVDASGDVIAFSDRPALNIPDDLRAGIRAEVPAGTYFLRVEGVGFDDPDHGFPDYGSLGQYTLGIVTADVPAPVSCQPGTYSTTGSEPCDEAPAGSFVDTEGATEATLCPVGTFSASAGAVACTEAPAGSFVDIEGATEATLCLVGTFSASAGAVACTDAPAGSFVDVEGATTATACPEGQTTDGAGSESGDACFPIDTDGDGVADVDDICPGTELPDEPTQGLLRNRFAATSEGFASVDGVVIASLADTGGCSATQIIAEAGLGEGHSRFGITRSALQAWIDTVPAGWQSNNPPPVHRAPQDVNQSWGSPQRALPSAFGRRGELPAT